MITLVLAFIAQAFACSPTSWPCSVDSKPDRAEFSNFKSSAPKLLKTKPTETYGSDDWHTYIDVEITSADGYVLIETDEANNSLKIEGRNYEPFKVNKITKTICGRELTFDRPLQMDDLKKIKWSCEEQRDSCEGIHNKYPLRLYHYGKTDFTWSAKKHQPTGQTQHITREFLINGKLETVEYDVTNVKNPNYMTHKCDPILAPSDTEYFDWVRVSYGPYEVKFRLPKHEDPERDGDPQDVIERITDTLKDIEERSDGTRPPNGAILAALRNGLMHSASGFIQFRVL